MELNKVWDKIFKLSVTIVFQREGVEIAPRVELFFDDQKSLSEALTFYMEQRLMQRFAKKIVLKTTEDYLKERDHFLKWCIAQNISYREIRKEGSQ